MGIGLAPAMLPCLRLPQGCPEMGCLMDAVCTQLLQGTHNSSGVGDSLGGSPRWDTDKGVWPLATHLQQRVSLRAAHFVDGVDGDADDGGKRHEEANADGPGGIDVVIVGDGLVLDDCEDQDELGRDRQDQPVGSSQPALCPPNCPALPIPAAPLQPSTLFPTVGNWGPR